MKKIDEDQFDQPDQPHRPHLELVEGGREGGRKTTPPSAQVMRRQAIEPEKPYAHAGAIARAMKANPGLTYEEAVRMARAFGF